jgi:hypothetical protein
MAVDVTEKALNICSRLVTASDRLMQSVSELAALKDEKESSGIDFTAAAVESALSESSLKHADGAAFNGVLSSGATLKTWLETNFHDDNFQKVRP